MKDRARLLLVVAPSLNECRRTFDEFGLSLSCLEHVRFVTRAQGLRGWRPGTPFVALNRDTWLRDVNGNSLDHVLTLATLSHHLRVANDEDLVRLREGVVA